MTRARLGVRDLALLFGACVALFLLLACADADAASPRTAEGAIASWSPRTTIVAHRAVSIARLARHASPGAQRLHPRTPSGGGDIRWWPTTSPRMGAVASDPPAPLVFARSLSPVARPRVHGGASREPPRAG